MATPDLHDPTLGASGLPYIVKATLGTTTRRRVPDQLAIAITVCCLAVQAGAIRMIFTMGRDK